MPAIIDLDTLKRQLTAYLKQHNFDLSADLTLLAHGEANVIFQLDRSRVIRVAVNTPNQRFGSQIAQVTQFEYRILNYLKGSGIGHDLQFAHLEPTADFPFTFLITNYIEGDPLNYSRIHLQQVAQTLANLHRLPLNPDYDLHPLKAHLAVVEKPLTLFFQEAQEYAQPYLQSAEAEPELVAMLEAVLKQAERRLETETLLQDYPYQCLVHSDHTYENWVISPQKACLIDWEWAELGSPAGDLGHLLSPITIRRYQGYRLPPADRDFFLAAYYDALDHPDLAHTIERHFAVFGLFPALRSLCWTAGYWITANRWYSDLDSPNAGARLQRLDSSRQQFSELWDEVMQGLSQPIL